MTGPKNPRDLEAKVDSASRDVPEDDAAFVPVRAESFVSGSKSRFDVFVKISDNKYLKLLQAGDSFAPERLTQYLKKGVTHFYIRREAESEYRKHGDVITSAVLKSKTLGSGIKVAQTLKQGEEVASFLKNQGVTEENLTHAAIFVGNVRELCHQLNPGQSEPLAGFLSNVGAVEHGTGTAMIAGILSNVIEIRMEKPVQIVGMACMLHDIALYQRFQESLWHEDEGRIPEGELEFYRTHPAIGVDILREIFGLDPAVIQAVEQHHMRANGSGFPTGGSTSSISKVSEIVAISDEFQRLIHKAKDDPTLNVQAEAERAILPQFSRQIAYAFRTAFFPKRAA